MTALPIDPILPDLVAALRDHGRAVLQAPPGAGKTTRVPLAMLDANLTGGRIIMLEPRRDLRRACRSNHRLPHARRKCSQQSHPR